MAKEKVEHQGEIYFVDKTKLAYDIARYMAEHAPPGEIAEILAEGSSGYTEMPTPELVKRAREMDVDTEAIDL